MSHIKVAGTFSNEAEAEVRNETADWADSSTMGASKWSVNEARGLTEVPSGTEAVTVWASEVWNDQLTGLGKAAPD